VALAAVKTEVRDDDLSLRCAMRKTENDGVQVSQLGTVQLGENDRVASLHECLLVSRRKKRVSCVNSTLSGCSSGLGER
jgi:hypothetical protein